MASYIARVELHQATSDDYQLLHGAMERRGYSRMIKGDNGIIYWLPTGTYDVADTTATLDQAHNAATSAAAETKKSSSIIVSLRGAASWNGLARSA